MSNASVYVPSRTILDRYSRVLVEFALHGGTGVKPKETVYIATPVCALPLAKQIAATVLEHGAFPMVSFIEDEITRVVLEKGSPEQIAYFPPKFYDGLAGSVDHWIRLLSENDPRYLEKIPPAKVAHFFGATKPLRRMLDKKEAQGIFSRTLCLYGTEGMAREANLSVRQYWKQIEKSCFLDEPDPVSVWRTVFKQIRSIVAVLDDLPIQKIHVRAPGTDLHLTLGDHRRWRGCSGRNIPSFEIFTSPDWRGTEGTFRCTMPLYRYGNVVEGIDITFQNGVVTRAKAKSGQKVLSAIIAQKNADKVGEFSLTDRRFSRIGKFMAETLYDENFGGEFGNTHIALGSSYRDTCTKKVSGMTDERYLKLGYNDSPEHTDIVATTDREVFVTLRDGSRKLLYAGGEFQLR